MLEQDFRAECDKDESADGFYFIFEEVADFSADKDAKIREHKRYKTNDYDRCQDFNFQKGKCNPDGKGVDTCSKRQDQQDPDI